MRRRRILAPFLALLLGATLAWLLRQDRSPEPPAAPAPEAAFASDRPAPGSSAPHLSPSAADGPRPLAHPVPLSLGPATDAPTASRAVTDDETELDEGALARLRALAELDPAATLDALLATDPPPPLRHFEEALAVWADRAPADALAWLLGHSLPASTTAADTRELTALVLSQWAQTAPALAADWLAARPEQSDQAQLRALFHPWLAHDEAAALAWLHTHLQPVQREALLPDLLLALRRPEPVPALLENLDPASADAALAQAALALDRDRLDYARFLADLIADESVRTPIQARLARRSTPSDLPAQPDSAPDSPTFVPTPPEEALPASLAPPS